MGNRPVVARRKHSRRRSRESSCHSLSSETITHIQRQPDWNIVTEIDYQLWHDEAAKLCGFDHHIAQTSIEHRVYKKPFTDNFVVTAKQNGIDRKLCNFSCEVLETGREEKVKTWVKGLSVLDHNSQVVVVQIVLAKSVKLFVVNWHSGQLLGTYSFAYYKEPCYQECFLSPDGTIVLTRQDYMLRIKLGHRTTFDTDLRVLEVKGGICRRMLVLEDTLFFNRLGSAVAFDPRTSHRRIIMVSSARQTENDPNDGIRVVDLKKDVVINRRESPISEAAYNVVYSPDGLIFAVLVTDYVMLLHHGMMFRNEYYPSLNSIYLFDSETLLPQHTFNIQDPSPICYKYIQHFPTFSRCGGYIAQYTGEEKDSVIIIQVPILQISLQHLCRSVILKFVPLDLTEKLPLPKKLLKYILYEPNE